MRKIKKITIVSLLVAAVAAPITLIAIRGRGGRRGGGFRGGRARMGGMRRGGFRAVGVRGPRGRAFVARGRGWRAAGFRGRGRWGRWGRRGRWGSRGRWGWRGRRWGGRWRWGRWRRWRHPRWGWRNRHWWVGPSWRWRGRWWGLPWWHRWRYRPTWWVGAWPPVYIDEDITLENRAIDELGHRYWEVYNATDITLTFYADDGSKSKLAPGERAKIFRGRSFGFAVVSPDGTLLNDESTKKHFITIFQRGHAADYTNREGKWMQ